MPTSHEDEFHHVRNASDRKQLKIAARLTKDQQKQWDKDVAEVLSLPAGRRLVWRIIKECKVFETIWHPSALIHYQSGQQDVGHMVMAWVNDASPEVLLEMLQANRTPKEN